MQEDQVGTEGVGIGRRMTVKRKREHDTAVQGNPHFQATSTQANARKWVVGSSQKMRLFTPFHFATQKLESQTVSVHLTVAQIPESQFCHSGESRNLEDPWNDVVYLVNSHAKHKFLLSRIPPRAVCLFSSETRILVRVFRVI